MLTGFVSFVLCLEVMITVHMITNFSIKLLLILHLSLQATFKITVDDVPSELTVSSNMPVCQENHNRHLKTVHFEVSPIMSTYLVAVVIGLFDRIEDKTSDGMHTS